MVPPIHVDAPLSHGGQGKRLVFLYQRKLLSCHQVLHAHGVIVIHSMYILNMPLSVYRLGEMPIQSKASALQAGKAGATLNARTELRAKRQRSAQEAIYRNRPIIG
jgi:hypothetical protein